MSCTVCQARLLIEDMLAPLAKWLPIPGYDANHNTLLWHPQEQ